MAKGEVYRSAFTKAELISAATIALVVGQFNKLGEYKVQAGEAISVGYGNQSGQESAQGRIFVDLRDGAAAPGLAMTGKVRLSIYSPQDRPLAIIGEWRTETLKTDAANRTLQVPYPENQYLITEDKKIVLEFMPDAAGTLNKANTTIVMDTTNTVA